MIETDLILAFLIGAITSGIGTAYYIRHKFENTAKSMAEDEEFQEFMDETIGNVMDQLGPEEDEDEGQS